jgi:ACS family pantothenate transporter-like MFS transporter
MSSDHDQLKVKPEVEDHELDRSNQELGLANLPQTRRARLKASIWDTWDKSPRERKLVQKVDWWLLSYACTAYFIKSLDQSNVSQARIHILR